MIEAVAPGESGKSAEPASGRPGTVFFTICAWNYLAYALTLRDSLIASNGSVDFYVAICDSREGFDHAALPFPVILLDELGVPSLPSMTQRYSITELNTAIKPFVFAYLFERHPGAAVVYMDPDILVASRLEELQELLSDGADCVLTPHILEPNEYAAFDDQNMLRYGVYNLGFCALRDDPVVRRVVSWWGRRLEKDCVIDLANGLFVDQKWADLLPAFVERTRILRHCGYNVAYWNLPQRSVRRASDGWSVNRQPLRFFHFSGNRIGESALFSRHSQPFNLTHGDAEHLFEEYAARVKANGHAYYRRIPYSFSWSGEAGVNLHTPEAEQARPLPPAGLGARRASEASDGVIPHLALLRARSLSEYERARALIRDALSARARFEADAVPAGESVFYLPGFCVPCGKTSDFQVSFMYSTRSLPDGRPVPNWREHLNCTDCGLVNRVRALLHILIQEARPAPEDRIYITEQVTPTYAWLARHFPGLSGSEYVGEGVQGGAIVDGVGPGSGTGASGVRHEDLQALTFPDGSFDYVLSLDVLEHVPDYRKALAEICRCLKNGGLFLFTVPFCYDRYEHVVRARMGADGQIEHLLPPEYHGNPVDPAGGSLCYRYFAWETLDELREVGFEWSECWFYWSRQFVYLGEPQVVIVARKPKGSVDVQG